MKKQLAWLGIAVLALGITQAAYAADSVVKVYKNSELVKYSVSPKTMDGALMIPVKLLSSFGISYSYDSKSKTVTLSAGSTKLKLVKGSSSGILNGKKVSLAGALKDSGGSLMIPAKFLKTYFGFSMNYDVKAKRLDLNNVKTEPSSSTTENSGNTTSTSSPSSTTTETSSTGTVAADMFQSITDQYSAFVTNVNVTADAAVFKVVVQMDQLNTEMHYEGTNKFSLGVPGLKKGSKIKLSAYDDQNKLLQTKDYTIN